MGTTRHGHARQELAKDVEEFLAKGGKIQKLPQTAAVRECLIHIGGRDGGLLPMRPRKTPRRQP